ncbi:MAG: MFS transporter [Chloroflexota bacterium]
MIKKRPFLLLWIINITTTLALELFFVTILVAVFEETSSTLQAAGTMVARMLPSFLLGPIAGVLVDRYPRKNVLISMDILRILLIGFAIWLTQSGESVPILGSYLVLAGLATADVFHRPARISLIPSLVEQDELVRANSFIMATNQIVLAVSYTVGGWLIQFFPLQNIVIGILILLILAIIAAVFMVVPKRITTDEAEEEQESVWEAFISGWRYLRGHPLARPLTIMETIEHVPHGIWTGALLLAFTVQALQGDTTDWGYQVTGYFSGMIVGSIIALGMEKRLNQLPGRIIVLTAVLVGGMTLIFAASPNVWFAAFVAFLFGPPFAIRDVAQDSLLQATVEKEQLGRVYATREMLRNVVFMFAGLFFAWLSDFMAIRLIYVIGGIIYIFTSIYAVSNRAIRTSQIKEAT